MPLHERDFEPVFPSSVYRDRLDRTKSAMTARGLDALLLADPTSQHYLSGFESRSWFSFQLLIVTLDEDEPVFTGRVTEERAGKITTWMGDDAIQCYPETYAHPNSPHHPAEWVADILDRRGPIDAVGVDLASDFLSAADVTALESHLTDVTFEDATGLVGQLYLRKAEAELDYVRKAARITDRAMRTAAEAIAPGVRENDAMAEITRTLLKGTEEYGGINPAGTPSFGPDHYRFSDRAFEEGDLFKVELSGSVRHFHKPLSRSVHVGEPSQEVRRMYENLNDDLDLLIEAIEPGRTCEEIDRHYRDRANYPNPTRSGYAAGYSVAPTWTEGTANLTEGDDTVLEPGMTFHLVPYVSGIGPDDQQLLHTEGVVVTDDGCATLGDYPRELIVV